MLDEGWCIACGNELKLDDKSTYCSVKCEASAAEQPTPGPDYLASYQFPQHEVRARLFKGKERARDIPNPSRLLPRGFAEPSQSLLDANVSSLKLEPLLGTQGWISNWVHDVHKHGAHYDATGHPQPRLCHGGNSILSSDDTSNFFAETSDGSLGAVDECEERTPHAHSNPRPHIRSRHSCPADMSYSEAPLSSIFSRPKLLTRSPQPITDLTPMHVALLPGPNEAPSSFRPVDVQRRASIPGYAQRLDGSEDGRAPRLEHSDAYDINTDYLPGAVTTSHEHTGADAVSLSENSLWDAQQELASIEQLQTILDRSSEVKQQTAASVVLELLKTYLQSTPSLTSISSMSGLGAKPKVRLTAASQATPKVTERQTHGRPRAHTTSYERVTSIPSHFPHFQDSPSITFPIETPSDCISELNLDSKKTPTSSMGVLGRAIDNPISDEYLVQALQDVNLSREKSPITKASKLDVNTISLLPSAFTGDNGQSVDIYTPHDLTFKPRWNYPTSPVPIARIPTLHITRGRPLSRDFATIGHTAHGRRRRSQSGHSDHHHISSNRRA